VSGLFAPGDSTHLDGHDRRVDKEGQVGKRPQPGRVNLLDQMISASALPAVRVAEKPVEQTHWNIFSTRIGQGSKSMLTNTAN
jgi:hypothetical protein